MELSTVDLESLFFLGTSAIGDRPHLVALLLSIVRTWESKVCPAAAAANVLDGADRVSFANGPSECKVLICHCPYASLDLPLPSVSSASAKSIETADASTSTVCVCVLQLLSEQRLLAWTGYWQ